MSRHDSWTEELLDFLLMRLDGSGFDQLVAHEPERMPALYMEPVRYEQRILLFTGCSTCGRSLPLDWRYDYAEMWPCQAVRSLMLAFADDPEFAEAWRPGYAMLASGEFIFPDQEEALQRLLEYQNP